ncbi:FOG: RRM domain [Ceraceosorus bombacis]|uniref:FOG: RRM domain n=1 Tax=Ceraceosorus bombacis TaxID=401625 RepID=A0A0P1BNZ3_9BASI|nr:FOG: RRM domain [Ceraceosorus bombacis]
MIREEEVRVVARARAEAEGEAIHPEASVQIGVPVVSRAAALQGWMRTDLAPEAEQSPRGASRRARAAERSPPRLDQAGRGARQEETRSVAVGGLSKAVHARHLEYIFGEYGSIEHVLLPQYKLSGENKGEAYIVYRTLEEASMAKSYMHAGQIDGCVISVELSSLPRSIIDSHSSRGPGRSHARMEQREVDRRVSRAEYGRDARGARDARDGHDRWAQQRDYRSGPPRGASGPRPEAYGGYGASYRGDRGAPHDAPGGYGGRPTPGPPPHLNRGFPAGEAPMGPRRQQVAGRWGQGPPQHGWGRDGDVRDKERETRPPPPLRPREQERGGRRSASPYRRGSGSRSRSPTAMRRRRSSTLSRDH